MSDSWCTPVRAKTGVVVSGGAARNVRIAAAGGMDEIVENISRSVARAAAREAFEHAEAAVRARRTKPRLRLVA